MLDENKIKFIKCYSRLLNDERLNKFDVILYGLIEYLSNNDKGFCTASNNTLASYLDCSRLTVIRSINKLVDCDYLKVKNKQSPNNKNITHRELKPSDVNDTTLVSKMKQPSDVNDTTLVSKMKQPSDVNDTLKELYKKNNIKEMYKKNNIKELTNINSSNKEHEKFLITSKTDLNPLADDIEPIETETDPYKF